MLECLAHCNVDSSCVLFHYVNNGNCGIGSTFSGLTMDEDEGTGVFMFDPNKGNSIFYD